MINEISLYFYGSGMNWSNNNFILYQIASKDTFEISIGVVDCTVAVVILPS